MMILKSIHLSILLLSLLAITACKKTEEQEIVNTPMSLKALPVSDIGNATVTFHGQIEKINTEPIREIGFILVEKTQSGGATNTEIVLDHKDVQDGTTINYTYTSKNVFDPDAGYYYQFYIKTANGYYASYPIHFNVDNITVSSPTDLKYNLGETILLKGNFSQFKEQYYLSINVPDGERLAFSLKDDNQTLAITLPKTGFVHGAKLAITLNKPLSGQQYMNSKQLAEVTIVAKINEPTRLRYAYNDIVELTGTGLPEYYVDGLFLLVGDQRIPYVGRSTHFGRMVDLSGPSFRFGYVNGRDSVIFSKPMLVEQPSGDDLLFSTASIHPGNSFSSYGVDMYKYFNLKIDQAFLGDKPVSATIGSDYRYSYISIPNDFPEGSYTLKLKGGVSEIVSTKTIEVKKLQWDKINKNDFYVGDTIQLSGNFNTDNAYVLEFKNTGISQYGFSKNQQLNIVVPKLAPGSHQIKVYYYTGTGAPVYAVQEKTINILLPTLERINPQSVYFENVISIEGHGLTAVHKFYIGNQEAFFHIDEGGKTGWLTIPPVLPSGKHIISMETGYGKVEAKMLLEVL